MKKHFLLSYFLFLISYSIQAQDKVDVYPSHWWVGMKWNKVQLLIHGFELKTSVMNIEINYPGVKAAKPQRLEGNNYLVLDLTIAPDAKPGIVKIKLNRINLSPLWYDFELKPRRSGNGTSYAQGVSSKDLVYLLMPDRFSNGDTTNDAVAGMRDMDHNRNNPFDRHGGDLLGVQNHLDYLKDLGVTTIWMTPVTENDMARTAEGGTSRSTYHGYAITDQFSIDKRFGGNDAYKKLVDAAHAKGLKIIQDVVYNHSGSDAFFVRDLPAKDWLNQWPSYQNTSYREQPIVDPNGSAIDKKISLDGWFTKFLVDMNQRNPYVKNYLIQYMIWNTEEFGVDGWRVDTYFYNEPQFLNDLNDALFKEFPKLGYFGEALVSQSSMAAYFCQNNLNVPFKHNNPGVTDFPLTLAMQDAFRQKFGGSDGVNRVYNTLANDFLYKDPNRNCIFLDNHDMDRIFSVLGEDISKMKAAFNMLLTMRGIPEMYFGDEILIKNLRKPNDA